MIQPSHQPASSRPFPVVGVVATITGAVLLTGMSLSKSFSETFPGVGRWVMFAVAAYLTLWGLREIFSAISPRSMSRAPRWNRHRMAVTREGIVYVAIMSVMFIGSILGRNNMLMLVFAMMIGPWVLNGWIAFSMLRKMKVRRFVPHRVTAGELVTVEVEVENPKILLSSWLLAAKDVAFHSVDEFQATVLFVRVPASQSRRGHYSVRFNHRGEYSLGPIELSTQFPLGLIERGLRSDEFATVIVHPSVGRLTSKWQRELWHASELSDRRSARRGLFDDEFNRIREYRSGDNPRAIHWRTTARRGDLMVREYHQTRDRELVLVLELWQPLRPQSPDTDRVELAVSFAATVVHEHLRQLHEARLQVVICGQDIVRWTHHSNGELLLDHLALARAADSVDARDITEELLDRLPASSQLVLVSSRSPAELNSRFGGLREKSDALFLSSDPVSLAMLFQLEHDA